MTETPGVHGPQDERPDYLAPNVITDLSADRRRGGRRWVVWLIAVDAVVAIVVVAGILGARAGWFSGDSASGDQSANLVASNPKALTAAVLAHIPSDVTIVWCNGNSGFDKLVPGAPSSLRGTLIASILMEKDAHQFYLSIVTSPAQAGASEPGTAYAKRDTQGRVVSENVIDSTDTSFSYVVEAAGPGGAGLLPLSESDLQDIVKDPLVGPNTTRQMLTGSENVPAWNPQGVITWPHSPI